MTQAAFDEPEISRVLEQLSAAEIDALPFGVVRLSADGVVELYSRKEAELSGFGTRRAVGRDFFAVIAPCFNTPDFQARIAEETSRGELDFEFGHTGDFADPARFVRARLCSTVGGGYWLLLMR